MIINVDVSVKNIIYVKNVIFGILLLVAAKWKIFSKYFDNSVITCD